MIDAGLTNDLADRQPARREIKAAAAAGAAGSGRITLAVESETNVRQNSDAARAAKSDIGVIIGRWTFLVPCGVSSPQQAVELGRGRSTSCWRGRLQGRE